MTFTLVVGDIHCGQTYEKYLPTTRQRLDKANNCINVLSEFQADYKNKIEKIIIVGDLCQRTGLRAASAVLEQQQLKLFGRGLQNHTAGIHYIAGSADPYFDEEVMQQTRKEFQDYLASHLKVDAERLQLPGLAYEDTAGESVVMAVHGHLPDLAPILLNGLMNDEEFQQDLRTEEGNHQMAGQIYEWGYSHIISKLPGRAGQMIDQIIKKKDRQTAMQKAAQFNLPPGSLCLSGHNHVPMADNIKGITVANPGSLTGAFRLNPAEPGSFMTVESDNNYHDRQIKLWDIKTDGTYGEILTTS